MSTCFNVCSPRGALKLPARVGGGAVPRALHHSSRRRRPQLLAFSTTDYAAGVNVDAQGALGGWHVNIAGFGLSRWDRRGGAKVATYGPLDAL